MQMSDTFEGFPVNDNAWIGVIPMTPVKRQLFVSNILFHLFVPI